MPKKRYKTILTENLANETDKSTSTVTPIILTDTDLSNPQFIDETEFIIPGTQNATNSKLSILNRAFSLIPFTGSNDKAKPVSTPAVTELPTTSVILSKNENINGSSSYTSKLISIFSRSRYTGSNSSLLNEKKSSETKKKQQQQISLNESPEAQITAETIQLQVSKSLSSHNLSSSRSNRSSTATDLDQIDESSLSRPENTNKQIDLPLHHQKKVKKSEEKNSVKDSTIMSEIPKANETALEKFENHFSAELLPKLICDNTYRLSSRIPSSGLVKIEQSYPNRARTESIEEMDRSKRNKLDEYANLEKKQANMLRFLRDNVYRRLNEEDGGIQKHVES